MGIFDFLFRKKDDMPKPPNAPPAPLPTRSIPTNWQTSKEHLLLLSHFIHCSDVRLFTQSCSGTASGWENKLNEPPQKALDRFISEGWLVPAPLHRQLGLSFNGTEIKSLLRERGLRISGTKDQGIERLIAADPEGIAAKVTPLRVYQCSPNARVIAEKFLIKQDDEKWGKLNQDALLYAKDNSWGLFRNTQLEMACALEKRGKNKQALAMMLWVCHLDLNEPNNVGGVKDPEYLKELHLFGPAPGPLAPAVVGDVEYLASDLRMDINSLETFYMKEVGRRANGIASITPLSAEKTWRLLKSNLVIAEIDADDGESE